MHLAARCLRQRWHRIVQLAHVHQCRSPVKWHACSPIPHVPPRRSNLLGGGDELLIVGTGTDHHRGPGGAARCHAATNHLLQRLHCALHLDGNASVLRAAGLEGNSKLLWDWGKGSRFFFTQAGGKLATPPHAGTDSTASLGNGFETRMHHATQHAHYMHATQDTQHTTATLHCTSTAQALRKHHTACFACDGGIMCFGTHTFCSSHHAKQHCKHDMWSWMHWHVTKKPTHFC